MSGATNKAVFLSYASQDAEAAKRVCEALRTAGVEVWFDQSELVGGDAWDHKIRTQIKDCSLLIPIISQNTQARTEGYFRLEWRLADQRTHLMAKGRPFLLPVVVDGTKDTDAQVPDSFLEVQWTKAPGGEVPAAFPARVKKLLSGDAGLDLRWSLGGDGKASPPSSDKEGFVDPALKRTKPRWLVPVLGGLGVAAILLAIARPWRTSEVVPPVPPASATVGPATAAEKPWSEARQKVERAMALSVANQHDSAGLLAAADLAEKATQLDSTDAEVWAIAGRIEIRCWLHGADRTDKRQEMARTKILRAKSLSPRSPQVRFSEARMFAELNLYPDGGARAESILRELLRVEAGDINPAEVTGVLGLAVAKQGRKDEAAKLFEQAGRSGAGWMNAASWMYLSTAQLPKALAAAREQTKIQRVPGLLQQSIVQVARGDLEAADEAYRQIPESDRLADGAASSNLAIALLRREPERILAALKSIPGDFLNTTMFVGPKSFLAGYAHRMAGREAAARVQWTEALALIDRRLSANGSDHLMLQSRLQALALLGRGEEAKETYILVQQLRGGKNYSTEAEDLLLLGRNEDALASLADELRKPGASLMYSYVRYNISFDPLRGDPRFETLLRETLPKGAKPFDEPKPLSEARQLVERAAAIWEVWPRTSERLAAAEQFCAQAVKLDPNDALTWAAASRVDAIMVFHRFDVTPERRQQALKKAARAMALAPEAFETRFAQAHAFSFADESPAMRAEAARIFRILLREKPADRNTLIHLGTTLRELEQYDEAADLFVRAGDASSEGWNYHVAGRFAEAARVADRMLAGERTVGAIHLKVQTERARGNLDAAQAAVDLFTPDELLTEGPVLQAIAVAQARGEYDRVIQLLNAYPQEYLDVSGFNGPKRLLIGMAHERAGRLAAARQEWQTALRQLDERLGGKSTEVGLIVMRALLLARLGEKGEAERALRLAQELTVASPNRIPILMAQLRLGHKEEVLAALEKAFGERKRGWISLYLSVRWNREFEVLGGDPRFEKLMRDNLPDGVRPLDEPKP